jgi:hypothetical protein
MQNREEEEYKQKQKRKERKGTNPCLCTERKK